MADNTICVPIPVSLFLEIDRYASKQKWAADPVTVIQNVMENWLDTQDWGDRTFPVQEGGFRWKHLLLPTGTQLRMRYLGKYHYAAIEGDSFVWDSKPSTPGQFVNGVSGTSRSAWRDLELKRPADAEWVPAQSLKTTG